MASAEQTDSQPVKKSGGIMTIVIWLVVVVLSIGGGFAVPLVVAQLNAPKSDKDKAKVVAPDPNEEVEFIDFDEMVAGIGGSRSTRYLKLNFSLQVAKSQRLDIEKKIDARKAILQDRILSYIADLTEDDINGKFGHNRLRRELHSFFNEILFDDGIELIQDVLFREINTQ